MSGELCLVAVTVPGVATKLLAGKAPHLLVARGGKRGGKSCTGPREMGELGAVSASWQSANAGEKSLREALSSWWSHREQGILAEANRETQLQATAQSGDRGKMWKLQL